MEEGKWYKCIETGSGVLSVKYYECISADYTGCGGDTISKWRDTDGCKAGAFNYRFDPTPHTRTTFPNMPDLIERVSKIDPAAAEWLEFGDHSDCSWASAARTIDFLFTWDDSPQGHEYWHKIYGKLVFKKDEQRSAPMKEYEYEAKET